jgi:hypothetical protein
MGISIHSRTGLTGWTGCRTFPDCENKYTLTVHPAGGGKKYTLPSTHTLTCEFYIEKKTSSSPYCWWWKNKEVNTGMPEKVSSASAFSPVFN